MSFILCRDGWEPDIPSCSSLPLSATICHCLTLFWDFFMCYTSEATKISESAAEIAPSLPVLDTDYSYQNVTFHISAINSEKSKLLAHCSINITENPLCWCNFEFKNSSEKWGKPCSCGLPLWTCHVETFSLEPTDTVTLWSAHLFDLFCFNSHQTWLPSGLCCPLIFTNKMIRQRCKCFIPLMEKRKQVSINCWTEQKWLWLYMCLQSEVVLGSMVEM